MSLLCCRDLAFAYDGQTILSGVNFEVGEGEYWGIVGENGSGKSTLIKGLLGIKSPSAGSIVTGDGLHPNEIGYLPQQTEFKRDFPASVSEVVLSGCLSRLGARPFYSRSLKAEARYSMEALQILPLQHRSFHELSGGQQQRVLLARALCATRKLLLLDEPAAGLDPLVTADLYRVIGHLNQKHGITVIMVTHDLTAITTTVSHVLHLGQTQLFSGTREDYMQSDAGKRFLGGAAHA